MRNQDAEIVNKESIVKTAEFVKAIFALSIVAATLGLLIWANIVIWSHV